MATRVFLGLIALLLVPYGLYCFFQPGFLEGAAGISSATPTGSTELRAMYGGLQVGFGLLALAALVQPPLVRPALIATAFLCGGLGIARLSGAALEGGWSLYTGMGMAFEFTALAGSLWLLNRSEATATA